MIRLASLTSIKLSRWSLFILCALCALLTACSARPHIASTTAPDQPEEVIEMSGTLIEAQGGVSDAKQLFEEGFNALESNKYERCEAKFSRYFEFFSDETYDRYARYNLGLCLEFQRKYKRAAEEFKRYVDAAQVDKDRLDGEVRLGYNLVFSGQHPTAIDLYSRLLTTEDLAGLSRGECLLRRAMAHTALGHYAPADQDISVALSYIRAALGPKTTGSSLLAEAHFQRGELYRQHMGAIQLTLPVSEMKLHIADKVRFFKKSLYAFVRGINVKNTYWAIASGHQLGALHEDLYEDIINAQAPDNFDEEMRAIYYFELEKKVAKLLQRSVSIYEKTVTVSLAQQASNLWVKSLQENLKRLRLLEAGVQMRLSMDPVEAYKLREREPFTRGEVNVPLPPIQNHSRSEPNRDRMTPGGSDDKPRAAPEG